MFKKAKQNRVFQDVVEQIQDAIVDGRLNAGDKLPAERELKDIFNTSRGTLREALRVLEQKGLIEIKLGVAGGAIVKAVNTDSVTDSLALLIRTQRVDLTDLTEFRVSMEGVIAKFAADRATDKDIQILKSLLNESKKNLESGIHDEVIRIDEKMHMELGRISGNPVFQFLQKTIHGNIHMYYDQYLGMDEENVTKNYEDFSKIVDAIEKRDPDLAAICLMEHVQRFSEGMEEILKTKKE